MNKTHQFPERSASLTEVWKRRKGVTKTSQSPSSQLHTPLWHNLKPLSYITTDQPEHDTTEESTSGDQMSSENTDNFATRSSDRAETTGCDFHSEDSYGTEKGLNWTPETAVSNGLETLTNKSEDISSRLFSSGSNHQESRLPTTHSFKTETHLERNTSHPQRPAVPHIHKSLSKGFTACSVLSFHLTANFITPSLDLH